MTKTQREWITPAAAPLQRSYGIVAVSQKYQNFKKSETTLSKLDWEKQAVNQLPDMDATYKHTGDTYHNLCSPVLHIVMAKNMESATTKITFCITYKVDWLYVWCFAP